MHFYTSINSNYLPKARVLAKSVKKYCPNAFFSLVLADDIPSGVDINEEYFDEIILVEDLGIPVDNLQLWIYMHTVVELCTAIKGQALVKFLESGSDKVVYLDPDITVFDDLLILNNLLNQYDVIITPHQTIPETNNQDVINNEICSLKHGIYNFGFYAVRNSDNGLYYAKWWRDRLINFCYDDIPNGLFTDQRWGDLAPAMFDGVYIWKDPGCNVSTWNLTKRQITKIDNIYYVNNSKLKFYHFSGFDSGAQKIMLDLYGKDNPYLQELRQWYIDQQNTQGQKVYGIGFGKSKYNYYDNGEEISQQARQLIRSRMDLLDYFGKTNPFITKQEPSYYKWYLNEITQKSNTPKITIPEEMYSRMLKQNEVLHSELQSVKNDLNDTRNQLQVTRHFHKRLSKEIITMQNTKTWKIRSTLLKLIGR